MNDLVLNTKVGLQAAWANIILFVPKVFLFVILFNRPPFYWKTSLPGSEQRYQTGWL